METILFALVFAAIVYWGTWVAEKNHRNVPLAAFWTTLFGIFSVIVYYIIGVKKDEVQECSKKIEVQEKEQE